MKKMLFSLALLFSCMISHGQNGLENIVVEKYYISNAADSLAADADAAGAGYTNGTLPVGSVTYRIYADLLPGYSVQALYGVTAHALKVTTTTSFYNNSGGSTQPNWNRTAVKNSPSSTVLGLDSWFSVGAAASNAYGILKSEDNVAAGGVNLFTTVAGSTMQNNNAAAGLALTTQDGYYYSGAPTGLAVPNSVTFVGLSSTDLGLFNDGSTPGNSFISNNGSVASLTGSAGPIAATNRVLIGQFTTNGVFHYELNLQVGTPTSGVSQNFVASNPTGNEISITSLTGTLGAVNIPPVCTITAPTTGSSFVTGTSISLAATATDADGTVTQVEFFVDGVSVGVDATSPYTGTYNGVLGNHTLTAVATDDQGATTTATSTFSCVANPPPTCVITAPATGSSFKTGDVVSITANATDNGSVVSVAFYIDGVLLSTDNTSPYTASYTATLGNHVITAIATDNLGATTTSSPVSITVANNVPPVVSITSPASNALYTAPAVVTINASASDVDGTVSQVDFYINGVLIGTDATSPYSINWTSVIGSACITAKATDNNGAQTTSAPVCLTIADPNALPYKVVTTSSTCLPSSFCIPVAAVDSVKNIIGYDVVMHYDKTKVTPTGVITVANALITPSYVDEIHSIDAVNGNISISLFFNASAPANANFKGKGNVFCVEFTKTGSFNYIDTTTVTVTSLQESYYTGVSAKLVDQGKFITYKDSTFNAQLKFMDLNIPIQYDAANPTAHLITNIYGNNSTCTSQSATAVQPNLTGNFSYTLNNGVDININKDILATTDVQPVVNGFDALLVRKVLLNDLTFIPTIYNITAMDVNLDGVISAGDVSQINQRAVLMIPEFRQAWNYNSSGVSNGQPSKDWIFIDSTRIVTNPAYAISTTYPLDNGVGYSKARVPVTPFCLTVPVTNATACPIIATEVYKSMLLGDIDGNFATVSPNALFRTNGFDKVTFDLSKATVTNGYADVPVYVSSLDAVNALDFSLQFNGSNLAYTSVVSHNNNMEALANFNQDDKTLRFTSNSLQNYELATSPVSVRFAVKSAQISAADLNTVAGYINGQRVSTEVIDGNSSPVANINVYPNPATGTLNVAVSENATVELLDMDGRLVILQTNVLANQKQEINIQTLANGVYMMKIYNDNFVSMKKVVVKN